MKLKITSDKWELMRNKREIANLNTIEWYVNARYNDDWVMM